MKIVIRFPHLESWAAVSRRRFPPLCSCFVGRKKESNDEKDILLWSNIADMIREFSSRYDAGSVYDNHSLCFKDPSRPTDNSVVLLAKIGSWSVVARVCSKDTEDLLAAK
ncbi:uncharacterized protein H6S33_000451 [Morchella sextelata]|uniref:uncharacterized protein n=1 Tax=Morchella sextelata TaxID=1174677 RepID=UPI001D039C51|nr:uncharacterized protein H6S33_000451 [Morchella sextelata]KAH0614815.1 hypothetical protein H6S33_000451 [Morchella sextelata]